MTAAVAWSLRSRFFSATAVLVVVLCCVFGVAVHEFIELLEDELLNRTLVREMAQFKRDVAIQPHAAPPSQGGLQGFIIPSASAAASLPRELPGLSIGVHEDVNIRGRNYYVDVQDSEHGRLYLLLDTERVDALEGNVVEVAFLVGLAGLAMAAAVALSLSRAVLREQAFTEDASHELRTPLAIVASAAELLSEEPGLSADGRERVVRIRRASTQMQSLIEALLFLARGEMGTRPQPCALDQVVRECVDVIAASAAAKSLQLEIAVEPVTVMGPPVMIACVVNNLLLNAVNFTQAGSIAVQLTATQLIVRDTGIGIPPQDLARIFERRYRGPQSRGSVSGCTW